MGKFGQKNFWKFFDHPSWFSQICCKISWNFLTAPKTFLKTLTPPPPRFLAGIMYSPVSPLSLFFLLICLFMKMLQITLVLNLCSLFCSYLEMKWFGFPRFHPNSYSFGRGTFTYWKKSKKIFCSLFYEWHLNFKFSFRIKHNAWCIFNRNINILPVQWSNVSLKE